jgi:hypothetical protein
MDSTLAVQQYIQQTIRKDSKGTYGNLVKFAIYTPCAALEVL